MGFWGWKLKKIKKLQKRLPFFSSSKLGTTVTVWFLLEVTFLNMLVGMVCFVLCKFGSLELSQQTTTKGKFRPQFRPLPPTKNWFISLDLFSPSFGFWSRAKSARNKLWKRTYIVHFLPTTSYNTACSENWLLIFTKSIQLCYCWQSDGHFIRPAPVDALKLIYIRSTPHPVTVTTRIITFLVGNSYKPSFPTVTVRGPHPKYTWMNGYMKLVF